MAPAWAIRGPGGWAYRVWQGRRVLREQSGTEQNTTNNRMDLRAAIEGLKSFRPRATSLWCPTAVI